MCGRKTLTKDIASIIHEMDIEECEANNYIPKNAQKKFSRIVWLLMTLTFCRGIH